MAKSIFKMLLAICVLTGTLWAGTDPFAGKWKLNPSRSKLTDEMRVTAVGPNKYDFNFSGNNVETVVVDGTDQAGLYGSTLAVSVEGPDTWKVVRKNNGRTTLIGIWKLSENDNTLTDSFTGFHDNGSTLNLHYVYKRTAGTSGFAGTWESAEEQVGSSVEIQIEPYQKDGLSIIYPASGVKKSLNFDDKDYTNTGPNLPEGYRSSAHRINDAALQMTDKVNEKVLNTTRIEISPDHKTLTMTTTIPGRSKPNIQVFDRE